MYAAEFATQTAEAGDGSSEADADYMLAELGVGFSGVTIKAGYELLGSDDGKYGFSTPLATLHKFNGFADQFLTTPNEGLQDTYLSISGKVAGLKLAATYHDFSADESTFIASYFSDSIFKPNTVDTTNHVFPRRN